jgi:hypothetical protein
MDEIDPLEIFGAEDLPNFDPNEEMVTDAYGKQLPRCHRIKNDGKRCRSWTYRNKKDQVFSNFCKMHGGATLEARASMGQVTTQLQIPFKEFFDEKFDLYLKELKTGNFRYSIDREIAALKALDDYTDEIIKAIDSPNVKDIERSVRMKERVANLVEKMTDIESKRAFQVTSNTLKYMFAEIIMTVKSTIKSPREQAAILRALRDIFSPQHMILEAPVENVENERIEASYLIAEVSNDPE